MTTSTLTVTGFVLARIAEREKAAMSCPPWPWRVATAADEVGDTWAEETVVAADGVKVADPYALSGAQTRAVRDHIAYHDPARVLAQCAAMRKIVELHEGVPHPNPTDEAVDLSCTNGGALRWPDECDTLRALASIWSDHAQYQQEWRA